MNAAKWTKLPVLLSSEEMALLIEKIPDLKIFKIGQVVQKGNACLPIEAFMQDYNAYLQGLLKGQDLYSKPFAQVWTLDEKTLEFQAVGEDKERVVQVHPSVVVQPHHFKWDFLLNEPHSMTFGPDRISWGLQFSYPHLFEDPHTHDIVTVQDQFVNTSLFRVVQLFIRHHTRPTPLIVNDKKMNLSIRIGHECFKWIANHATLREKGLYVQTSSFT
jgi:hypothetical protein